MTKCIQSRISGSRFKNDSAVIRLRFRLLEEEESEVIPLMNTLQIGIDSVIAHDFDHKKYLESLDAKKQSED